MRIEIPAREEQIHAACILDRKYDAYIKSCENEFDISLSPSRRLRRQFKLPTCSGNNVACSCAILWKKYMFLLCLITFEFLFWIKRITISMCVCLCVCLWCINYYVYACVSFDYFNSVSCKKSIIICQILILYWITGLNFDFPVRLAQKYLFKRNHVYDMFLIITLLPYYLIV